MFGMSRHTAPSYLIRQDCRPEVPASARKKSVFQHWQFCVAVGKTARKRETGSFLLIRTPGGVKNRCRSDKIG